MPLKMMVSGYSRIGLQNPQISKTLPASAGEYGRTTQIRASSRIQKVDMRSLSERIEFIRRKRIALIG
jgi:hypothetical protein